MVGKRHFKRLEQMYADSSPSPGSGKASVSYGRAELQGDIPKESTGRVGSRTPHHTLLSDAASLAAGSLEKERHVTAEHFQADVKDAEYRGPVSASARVVAAQPPRYIVQAVLRAPDGSLVASAMGVFHPTRTDLPDAPNVALDDAPQPSAPPPASFIPVFDTPFGPVCLN